MRIGGGFAGVLNAGLMANSGALRGGIGGSSGQAQAAFTNLLGSNPQAPLSVTAKPTSSAAAQLFNQSAGLIGNATKAPVSRVAIPVAAKLPNLGLAQSVDGLIKNVNGTENAFAQLRGNIFSGLMSMNNRMESSTVGKLASLKDGDAVKATMSRTAREAVV